MSVVIDCHSAARLVAEGAICFDTDTQTATCDGLAVSLDSAIDERTRPVLVCGSSDGDAMKMVSRLERLGVAAWRVLGDGQRATSGPECCGASAVDGVVVSRAE